MNDSFELNKNSNKKRKQSWDIFRYSQGKNLLNKNRRKSMMNFELKKYMKAKNDTENQKRKKFLFHSNAKLNIINILNTCMHKDIYNEISFINKENDEPNKDVKKTIFESKNSKKHVSHSNSKKNNNLNQNYFNSNKSNERKYLSSLSSESSNHIKQTNIKLNENELTKDKKKTSKKNIKKLRYHTNNGRKSVDLSHFNKRININLKKSTVGQKFKKRASLINNKIKKSVIEDMSQIETIKINENIFNDINLLQLKKKISKLKKTIKSRRLSILGNNNNNNNEIITLHSVNDNSNIEESEITTENKTDNTLSKLKKTSIKNIYNNGIYLLSNKNRRLIRKANLFDSIDDEEYLEEELDYYISPNSLFIKFFDFFLLISSLIYFIFIPYFLSQNLLISNESHLFKIILRFSDIIYIIDLIINFFKAYKNYDEILIKKTKKIFFHYLKSWFVVDLIQAFPYFSFFNFLEKKYDLKNQKIYIMLMIKAIKIYKIMDDNTTISFLSELFSKIEIIDDHHSNIEVIFIFLSCLNMTTCLYIFLGNNYYPSWIIKLTIQDESYLNIYLTSLYFVIVTITTVGYGDITGDTIPEILFQIILLILGTIAYSFIISYFSNYIVKINQKSLNFENKLNILNEIKLHHPNMKNSLYKEVLRNLHNEEFYEKKDKQILFQGLPYSLKNKLIMEMYKPIIKNFVFFKDIDNSDFIVKVATSLKPLISVKGDILIREGDFIKEIFFIKKGVMGLNLYINLNNPESSIQKYFELIEIGDFNISHIKSSLLKPKETNTKLMDSKLDSFLFNKDEDSNYTDNDDDNTYIEDINIIEIRAREHFGDALMFLNERCPLNARIRTRTAELLILRKMEAIEIYSIYPNIWKRINKKSLYNMEQIYLKIKKIINEISIRYKLKTLKYKFKKQRIIINKKKDKNDFLSNVKSEIQKKNNNKKNENKNDKNKTENDDKINDKNFTKEIRKHSSQNISFSKINPIEKYSSEIKDSQKMKKKKSSNSLNIKDKNNTNNEIIKIPKNNKNIYLSKLNSIKSCQSNKANTNSNIDEYYKERDINNEIYKDENFVINFHKKELIFPEIISSNENNSEQSFKDNNLNNLHDSNNCCSIKNILSSKLLISHHEKLNNKFINLSSTKENSIYLNSSYENINKISNYKYINNMILQNKAKHFIEEECTKNLISPKEKNDLFLSPGRKIPNITINYENPESYKSSMENKMNDNSFDKIINLSNTLKNIAKKNKDLECNLNCKSSNEINTQKNTISRVSSHKNCNKNKKNNIFSPISKKRTINKKLLIGKKLNVISQNIQNANEAINNPNEFYMNFFNNILQKESFANSNEEDASKNKKNSSFINNFSEAIDSDKKGNNKNNRIEPKFIESKLTYKKKG